MNSFTSSNCYIVSYARKSVVFNEANSESNICACIRKAIHQKLRCDELCDATVVSSANIMSLIIVFFYFCLCIQARGVEQFAVGLCMQV